MSLLIGIITCMMVYFLIGSIIILIDLFIDLELWDFFFSHNDGFLISMGVIIVFILISPLCLDLYIDRWKSTISNRR